MFKKVKAVVAVTATFALAIPLSAAATLENPAAEPSHNDSKQLQENDHPQVQDGSHEPEKLVETPNPTETNNTTDPQTTTEHPQTEERTEPKLPTPENMPWLDQSKTPAERADALLKVMTKDQLIHMSHGVGGLIGLKDPKYKAPKSIGYVPPIPELRIPALVMTDGPTGLRNLEKGTQMPAPIAVASSFDTNQAYNVGNLMSKELKERGQDVLFGPGFNLARNPEAGRTFEYYGEDPYLSGKLAGANVRGLQDGGIMATLKHYVANNQETNRTTSSSNIDRRTLREMYEKPFEIAVKDSDPASVMCAYNKVNNVYACSNKQTLTHDLKEAIGFNGFVVSDYPSTHAATDLDAGLSIELPSGKHMTRKKIETAIAEGKLSWDTVKARVRETLIQMFRFGLFDHPWDENTGDRERNMKEIPAYRGYEVSRTALENGAVLMKNEGMLPLTPEKLVGKKKILVVGYGAKQAISGGGSSNVDALIRDNFLTEFKRQLPINVEVVWKSNFDPAGIAIESKKADYVIVVAGVISTELLDRLSLNFLPHVNNAVDIATKYNNNVAVVTQIPGPTLMPWSGKVNSILNVWYPGEAGGAATTNLLLGKVNPSGRLPQTFPAYAKQKPANTFGQFPGNKLGNEVNYTEGLNIGYRYYDANNQKPAFPFGYGLSYTTFEYGKATLSAASGGENTPVTVSFSVTNKGKVAGAVVPQIYVGKPTNQRYSPPKELGAFTKIFLQPGETKQVTLKIVPDQLSVFDTNTEKFLVQHGNYRIIIADNARDIKETLEYRVN